MSLLQKPRLQFQGELHDITLVNFSVDPVEVRHLLPPPLELRLFNGRAMISMVDVCLRNMRAKGPLGLFKFDYQHIGFRLLVKDAAWNEDAAHHGIYFLDSFTDRKLMAIGGSLLSNYRLSEAHLHQLPQGLNLRKGEKHLHYDYSFPIQKPSQSSQELRKTIGTIDRAWAVEDDKLFKTQILREKWPLEAVQCNRFETNFFQTARLEGVFRVPETIYYTWLPAEPMLDLQKEVFPPITAPLYA